MLPSIEQARPHSPQLSTSVSRLKPLEGFERSYLPGGIEAERERAYREGGIPVGERHRDRLEKLGAEIGIEVPW